MPGHNASRANKNRGRRSQAALTKNQRHIDMALGLAPGNPYQKLSFARVTANRQHYFSLRVLYKDTVVNEVVQGSPCGTFGSSGKVRMRISIGDVVVVEGLDSLPLALEKGKPLTVDINGRLSKKQAQQAFRAGIIPRAIYKEDPKDEDDDLFDYDSDYSEQEDEEHDAADDGGEKVIGVKKKKSKAPVRGAAGRGSGGRTGLGGLASRSGGAAGAAVKEQLDAVAFAGRYAAAALAEDEEEEMPDLDALEAAGAAGPKPKKKKEAPAPAPAPAATAFDLYNEPERAAWEEDSPAPALLKKVKDCWEDEDDELDIDAI